LPLDLNYRKGADRKVRAFLVSGVIVDSEIVGLPRSERRPIPWPIWALAALGFVTCIVGISSVVWLAGALLLAFVGWALFLIAAGPPRLLLDARGITRQQRFTADRHIPWSAIQAFSVEPTPPLWWRWRVGLLAVLSVTAFNSAGLAGGLPSWEDTASSSLQIRWRGQARPASDGLPHGGWIKGNFGLSQEVLLAKLEAWLEQSRSADLSLLPLREKVARSAG
jgi:hypothetical protein